MCKSARRRSGRASDRMWCRCCGSCSVVVARPYGMQGLAVATAVSFLSPGWLKRGAACATGPLSCGRQDNLCRLLMLNPAPLPLGADVAGGVCAAPCCVFCGQHCSACCQRAGIYTVDPVYRLPHAPFTLRGLDEFLLQTLLSTPRFHGARATRPGSPLCPAPLRGAGRLWGHRPPAPT